MIVSMTGFAARRGQGAGAHWQWDIRSVNGKGLDLRLRLPEWIDGLEQAVRAEVTRRVQRGNVSLSLRLQRDAGAEALRVNRAVLDQALSALAEVTAVAEQRGLMLDPPTAADVLAMRGVLDQAAAEDDDTGPLRAVLIEDLAPLLDDFTAVRRSEGTALAGVIAAQIDRIGTLTADAATEAAERRHAMAQTLREALARVLSNADGVDEARVAQELALIAVKADVTEEIDRLTAHVAAARALLADPAPVGRKLDFLTQEFNREANTLCSKAQSIALTRIGLDLKTVIDQMREQIQNVE
jgi:uncharacterized protein (TIGR00255 family)